jgi:hypothetical protein
MNNMVSILSLRQMGRNKNVSLVLVTGGDMQKNKNVCPVPSWMLSLIWIILAFIPEKHCLYLGSLAEVSVHPPTLHFRH